MGLRRRVDKRRQGAHPLTVASAFAQAQVIGCAGVPDDVSLDDLFDMFGRVKVRPGTWADLCFRIGHPHPCQAMDAGDDGFGPLPTPGCSEDVCLFAGEPAGTATA